MVSIRAKKEGGVKAKITARTVKQAVKVASTNGYEEFVSGSGRRFVRGAGGKWVARGRLSGNMLQRCLQFVKS